MAQLDQIEKKLDALTEMVSKLVKAHETTALSDAMSKAVEQTLAIQKSQEESSSSPKPELEKQSGKATPRVDKPTGKPGETLPYKPLTATAPHRPDQFGGAPPVEAGAPDPDTPDQWKGVPEWEEGREPRVVEILRQKAKKKP